MQYLWPLTLKANETFQHIFRVKRACTLLNKYSFVGIPEAPVGGDRESTYVLCTRICDFTFFPWGTFIIFSLFKGRKYSWFLRAETSINARLMLSASKSYFFLIIRRWRFVDIYQNFQTRFFSSEKKRKKSLLLVFLYTTSVSIYSKSEDTKKVTWIIQDGKVSRKKWRD